MQHIDEIYARAGHYIADEVSVNLSRKLVTIAAGSGIVRAGTVLGQLTASSKYVPLDEDAATGAEDAAGINFETVDATTEDVEAVISHTLTAVNASEIIWPEGISDADKTAAIAALEARQIAVLPADALPSGS